MKNLTFSNFSSRGGIISMELLEYLKRDDTNNPFIQYNTFRDIKGNAPIDRSSLDNIIKSIWKDLNEQWDAVSLRYKYMSVNEARIKWIIPLLKAFGFEPIFNKQNLIIGNNLDLKFKLSHFGWNSEQSPLIHTISPNQSLDSKEIHENQRKRSPHDELQSFLNVWNNSKWGIVTNGILLRILREFHHTTTNGYIEFDLENIFRERNFADFKVLFRIAHSSRFMQDQGQCIIERIYEQSVSTGVTVGRNLRKNVKQAIESLANGLLTEELLHQLIVNGELLKQFFSEVLVIIYRLLFLLFAEQRGMLPTRGSIYAEQYSVTKLRELAEDSGLEIDDAYSDLWEGLKITFSIIKNGSPELKIFGYDGNLFDESHIPLLNSLSCKNSDLIIAIRNLTLLEQEKIQKRINYLDLGIEEIGSIYENLLQYTPRILNHETRVENKPIPAKRFFLDPQSSNRKTSGSYYTNPGLIDSLIKSALKPVLERKLEEKNKEDALLRIKICDPACGSGAFLIAATNYLGKELANIRHGVYAQDKDIRKSRRDVLQHCIYGVDANPMAVELAKVSLWIDASVEDMPLNFLDHHIKIGNSLFGTFKKHVKNGIPEYAFEPIKGESKAFSKKIKLLNKNLSNTAVLDEYLKLSSINSITEEFEKLSEYKELKINDVTKKKTKYEEIIKSIYYNNCKLAFDAWTASFFWPLMDDSPHPPLSNTVEAILRGSLNSIDKDTENIINKISSELDFFHWELEFPDVFDREDKGFDCVLGNPPWEKIKTYEKEYFQAKYPEISNAKNATDRKEKITKLKETDPLLWLQYSNKLKLGDKVGKFFRKSGRYDLSSKGDINTYSIFTETFYRLLGNKGMMGIIVPTALVTSDTNKDLFGHFIENNELISIFDFVNEKKIFDIHSTFKFSLITIGKGSEKPINCIYALTEPNEINNDRKITLTKEDLLLFNPNTKTSPIFRTSKDFEITKKVYKKIPILINESTHNKSWPIRFFTMFHMTNDNNLFKDKSELELEEYELTGNIFSKEKEVYIPLYEGKMIWIYNHRVGSIEYSGIVTPGKHDVLYATADQLSDPGFVPLPRFWVKEKDVIAKVSKNYSWFLGFRDTARSTDKRTSIFTVIPFSAVGNKLPLIFFESLTIEQIMLFLANANSLILDYICRQKNGGTNMNFFILKQIPIISYDRYDSAHIENIIKMVFELIYTSFDLKEFARELKYLDENGNVKQPFNWDERRRRDIQGKIDALYFHLYGIEREEVEYILDTFEILKNEEIETHGEFLTKRNILKHYDNYPYL